MSSRFSHTLHVRTPEQVEQDEHLVLSSRLSHHRLLYLLHSEEGVTMLLLKVEGIAIAWSLSLYHLVDMPNLL